MKKILILVICLLTLVGCANEKKEFPKDYTVGLVTTTEKKRDSNIKYFNENLEILYEENVDYPALGDTFYQPTYMNNKMYLTPNGLMKQRSEKKILEIELDSGEKKEYKVDKENILNVASNDEYLYTLSNSNKYEYLTMLNKNGDILKEISDTDNIMTLLVCIEDRVCLFKSRTYYEGEKGKFNSFIEVYDKQLNLLKSIDLSNIAKDQMKFTVKGNLLFFSNDINDGEKGLIGIFDVNSYSIQYIELKTSKPSDLIIYGHHLYVAHSDIVIPDKKKISAINLENYQDIKEYNINQTITRMEIYNSNLYILSSSDEKTTLSKYGIDDLSKELKNVEISVDREMPYYTSVLFTNKI